MKKSLIGSLVGGTIIFFWQFLSFAALDLHRSAQEYTPAQDEIMAFLSTHFKSDGAYFIPNLPKGASSAEMEKAMADAQGKPWAQIHYHTKMDANMGVNMARGWTIDVFIVFLLCMIVSRFGQNSFSSTLSASLFVGLISFFNSSYTNHIWYPSFDLMQMLIDAVVSWGLTGAWLGWWLNKSK